MLTKKEYISYKSVYRDLNDCKLIEELIDFLLINLYIPTTNEEGTQTTITDKEKLKKYNLVLGNKSDKVGYRNLLFECKKWITQNKPIYIFGKDADKLIKRIDKVLKKEECAQINKGNF